MMVSCLRLSIWIGKVKKPFIEKKWEFHFWKKTIPQEQVVDPRAVTITFCFCFFGFFFEIKFELFFLFSKKIYINRQILGFKSQQTHKMIKNNKKINVLKMVHMKIHLKFHDGHQHFFCLFFFNKINMPLKSENVIFLISKLWLCMRLDDCLFHKWWPCQKSSKLHFSGKTLKNDHPIQMLILGHETIISA